MLTDGRTDGRTDARTDGRRTKSDHNSSSWAELRWAKKSINNTQIRRRCMRHLIRTYMVRELIYQIWDWQTVLIKTKKKRKKTGAFKRCILLSLSVKRPLIFWTRRLHLDVLQSQCIHTCHTNGLIIRLPLLMIRVNCLLTAQRSVKCWFFDNVWIMT